MSNSLITYIAATGEATSILHCSSSIVLLNLKEGESAIPLPIGVVDIGGYYVAHELGTLVPKADYTLGTLPLPCTLTIEGVRYENVTTQPTFEFDAPGAYIIQVDAGPQYLKKEFTLDYQPSVT